MDTQLRDQLNTLRTIRPDDAWRAEARTQLLQQARGSARPAAASGWGVMIGDTVRGWSGALAQPAYALAMALVIMVAGGLFSISAASEATPGSTLYTAKLIGEKTQFAFLRSPQERVRLHATLAERRAEELGQVVASNDRVATQVAARLVDEVHEIQLKLTEIEAEQPQDALAVAREVEIRARQLRARLESTRATVASDAADANRTLDEAIDSVDQTELAALRTIAKAAPATETDEQAVAARAEVGEKVANRIAETKEKIAAASETIDAVFSASLVRTDNNVQVTMEAGAKSKADEAAAVIAEAEALLKEDNYTEALDKISESETLLNEAAAATAAAQTAPEAGATSTPATATTTGATTTAETTE